MKQFACLVVLLCLTAVRGQAEVLLSCAGSAGLRGYQIVLNNKSSMLEVSMYSINEEGHEIWLQRSIDDVSWQNRDAGETLRLTLSPLLMRLEVDDRRIPVVAVRQFGIRFLNDPCDPDALVWRPDSLRRALEYRNSTEELEAAANYASSFRSSAQRPLASE